MVNGILRSEFSISGRKVGADQPVLVIAEIGINHNGSLEVAKKMVKAAVRCGAEIVKHQTHIPAAEMASAARETIPGNANVSIYDIIEACALSEDDERRLQQFTNELGCMFISTPFSREAADRLADMSVPAFKIGSGECSNLPLVEHIADYKKPIILSTGMHALDDLKASTDILIDKDVPFAILHTTNLYPTPDHLVRLGALTDISNRYPGLPFGLSDHTTSNLACFGAVTLGASILERHFTDDMGRDGPDIICSMDPQAMEELLAGCDILRRQRGGNKSKLDEEQVTRNFAYSSVVSTSYISAGEDFNKTNTWVKRPGTGEIKPADYYKVIGKKAKRNIAPDTLLTWNDILK